ncbi:UNVERIFIED_CONTAM: putative protein ycf45, partial [Sesamum calycinum]
MHLFDSTSEAYRIDSDFFNPGRLLLTQAMKLEVMDRGSAGIADIRESVSIVSLSCSIWIPDVDFQMQIVVDTSNEIGGDGDIPHPAIGEHGDCRYQRIVSIVSLSCSIWIPDVDFQMQIVVDTSNEIGGDGDIPHPAIGEHGDCRESVSIVSLSCSIWIPDVDFQMQIVVDTSNEIGGDGDIPHPAIGGARRLQVPDPCMKHKVMIEAVDNHMPEVGGLKTVILSDEAARTRNCKKIILERRSAPAFPFLIEMRERDYWVAHRGTPLLWKQIGLNSWRRSSTRRIRTATEETLQQFCCCTFVLLLPAAAAAAPAAAAVLLLLLLHFASADAAAALLLCCRCCCYALLLLCCCVLLLLQLRFANAAAVFCCCCSLLRGRTP